MRWLFWVLGELALKGVSDTAFEILFGKFWNELLYVGNMCALSLGQVVGHLGEGLSHASKVLDLCE